MVPLAARVAHEPVFAVGDVRISVVVDLLAEIAILALVVCVSADLAQVKESVRLLPLDPLRVTRQAEEATDLVATSPKLFLGVEVNEGLPCGNSRWQRHLQDHVVGSLTISLRILMLLKRAVGVLAGAMRPLTAPFLGDWEDCPSFRLLGREFELVAEFNEVDGTQQQQHASLRLVLKPPMGLIFVIFIG